jgi:molybdopterin converting factor small subunit
MIRVAIPSQLRSYTQAAEVEARGETIAAAFDDLDARFPGLRFRVVDEQGRIRKHMHVFLNGRMARDIALPTKAGDELIIVGALSGG